MDWLWYILIFMAGAMVGAVLMGLCAASKTDPVDLQEAEDENE